MAGMRTEGCISFESSIHMVSNHCSESDPFEVRADRPDEPVRLPEQTPTVGFRLYVNSSMVTEMTNKEHRVLR